MYLNTEKPNLSKYPSVASDYLTKIRRRPLRWEREELYQQLAGLQKLRRDMKGKK